MSEEENGEKAVSREVIIAVCLQGQPATWASAGVESKGATFLLQTQLLRNKKDLSRGKMALAASVATPLLFQPRPNPWKNPLINYLLRT